MRRRNYNGMNRDLRQNYQQPASYVYRTAPPARHHPLLWILVVILCLGAGWFAADHFMGNGSGNVNQQSRSERVVKKDATAPQGTKRSSAPIVNHSYHTRVSVNENPPATDEVQKIEAEMSRLGISDANQIKAENYFAKQSPKNQARIIKAIAWANRLVPSDALKRHIIFWILK